MSRLRIAIGCLAMWFTLSVANAGPPAATEPPPTAGTAPAQPVANANTRPLYLTPAELGDVPDPARDLRSQWWVSGEYLLWWMRSGPTPPLVVADAPGTPRAGVGVPGTPGQST